ncbi:MAG: copper homeostasis protein CutC [Acidobacteriota bacterium]
MTPVLEVIACSVNDAVEAEKGGASRLEVISHFDAGGLTPPAGLVAEIAGNVSLPLRVMIREKEGYEAGGRADLKRLRDRAREMADLGVDGLVLGFLRGGALDNEALAFILEAVPDTKVTFHHAFEALPDPLGEIPSLKQHPQIDRILTAGGTGGIPARVARLARYKAAASPQIQILAGGGMNEDLIRRLRRETRIVEFHTGRATRFPPTIDGPVNAERVRRLLQALDQERKG